MAGRSCHRCKNAYRQQYEGDPSLYIAVALIEVVVVVVLVARLKKSVIDALIILLQNKSRACFLYGYCCASRNNKLNRCSRDKEYFYSFQDY